MGIMWTPLQNALNVGIIAQNAAATELFASNVDQHYIT
jgi:hypothetical protein